MSMAIKHAMNKRKVKSGNTGGNDTPYGGKNNVQPDVSRKDWGGGASAGTSLAGEHVRGAAMAKENGQRKAQASRTESAKNLHKEAISNLKNDKQDRTNLARGGRVEGNEKGVHAEKRGYRMGTSEAGFWARGEKATDGAFNHRALSNAKHEHQKVLSEMKEQRGKDRTNLADGGDVKPVVDPDEAKKMAAEMKKAFHFAKGGDVSCAMCQGGNCMEHGGIVDRIMEKRRPVTADEMPNEFDELELEPAPSPPHSGKDYGDDLGEDMISKIMRKRRSA